MMQSLHTFLFRFFRLFSRLTRINKSTLLRAIIIVLGTIGLLLALEAISFLTFLLLSVKSIPLPWSFYTALNTGFRLPVLISLVIVVLTVGAVLLWFKGGVERVIANSISLLLIGFIGANTIALIIYRVVDGVSISIYPWVSYTLFSDLPVHSMAYRHFLLGYLASIGTTLLFVLYFLSKQVTALSQKNLSTRADNVHGHAHFANALEVNKARLFGSLGSQGIVIGKAYGRILRVPGFEGVMVTAPTGSGKSMSIAMPNLLEWMGSGIFNDLKNELYKATAAYRERVLGNLCFRFAPADGQMNTHRFNPFYYVRKDTPYFIGDIQMIAEIMIPKEHAESSFWYTSSRDIFILLAIHLFETTSMPTLPAVHDLSKIKDFFEWLESAVDSGNIENPVFYQNAHSLLLADKERTRGNILKDFHARLSQFVDPLLRHATSGNDFDFRELRQKKMSIYLHIPESKKEHLKPILTLFLAQFINFMTEEEPDPVHDHYPILALMDEFGNMARIEKLKDGLSFLRAYQIRPIIIVQHLAQITSIYGRDDAEGFLNSKVKVFFTLNSLQDAQFFSKSMGNKTIRVTSRGSSHGHHSSSSRNISYQSRPLMTPDEIMQMSKHQAIILVEGSAPIKATKCYWYKEKNYKFAILSPN